MINSKKLILASSSPRRLELLKNIGITPDQVLSPDIDETPLKNEKPKMLALRLAEQKARTIYKTISSDNKDSFVLAADSVVACGQMILDKAETSEYAMHCIQKLSGRRHHIYGGIAVINPKGQIYTTLCDTLVQFRPLSQQEMVDYVATNQWEGKAGGYAVQEFASTFVKYIAGSHSNIVGLSLYDTMKLLKRAGFITK